MILIQSCLGLRGWCFVPELDLLPLRRCNWVLVAVCFSALLKVCSRYHCFL